MDTKLNINAIEELSIPVTKLKDPENLTTGFANDLTGRKEATAEEFTLRPSAGNKSIRDDSATIKRIKGNSIVWNQLSRFRDTWAEKGLTATNNGNEIHISGTVTEAFNYDNVLLTKDTTLKRDGRKYLISIEAPTGVTYGISGYSLNNSSPFIWSQDTGTDWGGGVIAISVPLGTTIDYTFKNPIIIDLTQMFGVGNEPDTVEEFRALFPGNHYEHNSGQLVSMTADGLFTNGFNQWDEEWINGYYRIYADSGVGNDGAFVENSSYIATAKPMKVLPNTQYYVKSPYGVLFGECDIEGNYTGNHYYVYAGNTFTTSSNCFYLLFYVDKAITNATYNNDICINLSHTGVENGKYEPYWDAIKDLSIIQKYFPNGMRSAGNIYDEISFDETTQKWVAIQRVGNVDLGTLTWTYSNNEFVSLSIESLMTYPATSRDTGNILCSKYSSHPYNGSSSLDKAIFTSWQTAQLKAIWIKDSAYSDAASFKTAMSGVTLNYELAEPIITVIEEPINLSYKVGDFGIEQTLSDSFSAPFRADIIYQFNATDRIRENSLNIEKLSKTQNECLLLAGGTMSGQINSQDIKPVEDSTYQLGDSTYKYDNVFSNFFTGNLDGNAKTASDLTGRIEATPEMFTYHPSAGEKSIKDNNAFIRRVKGNSVVWNQQLKTLFSPNITTDTVTTNGITFTKLSSGGYTISGSNDTSMSALSNNTTVNLELKAGHKYIIIPIGLKKSTISFYGPESGVNSFVTADMRIITPTNSAGILLRSVVQAGVIDVNETIYCNVHDLTQMFGAGNEPTTVEEFRTLYPNSDYPYNTGELRNLDCSGIKTVGFNQWDEQWERGTLNSVGENDDTSTTIRSKNYNPAIGGADYYVGIASEGYDNIYYLGISWYDNNKQFISKIYCNQRVITSPINAAYFRIFTNTNSYVYGPTYNNDICVNLHHTGWRDGEYEQYKEVTHALPLSHITNGEPLRYVYNSHAGEQYDEINETEYIKRIGVVDLGTLNWSWDEANSVFITYDLEGNGNAYRFFCSKYTTTNYGFENMADKTIRSTNENSAVLGIKDSSFGTDASALKASLAGVMLNYELAEPIVTPIETPIDFNYYVEDFGTEEALLTEDSAPFSADIVYQFNATDTIRVLEKNIKQLLNKITSLENIIANAITNDNNL